MGVSSIAELRKAREAQSAKLRENLTKKNEYANDDERFWRPKTDDAGTGYAVIRFLPPIAGEEMPYITLYEYHVKGPGGWYINRSLQTIGQPDPMNEFSRSLWENKDSMSEAEKQYARQFSRRVRYVSNILVLEDPGQEENEGKVFLFGYGAQVMDKIKAKESPEFKGEVGFNPYDFWDGATFKLKIRQKGEGKKKFPNYEQSEFMPQSALFDGDEAKLEAIWKQQYSLQELLDLKHFKTYDELQKQMVKALKRGAGDDDEDSPNERSRARNTEADDEGPPFDVEETEATTVRGSRRRTERKRTDADSGDDEGVSFVRELANR